MIRDNYRLLERGYVFVNADFFRHSNRHAVEDIEVYDTMVECLCSVCNNRKPITSNGYFHIVALVRTAHHIAVIISNRLKSHSFQSRATLDGKIARLSRLTYGAHKVGYLMPIHACLHLLSFF